MKSHCTTVTGHLAPVRPTVVMGLGNPLMGDDGLGLVVMERLQRHCFEPEIQFVDGGTAGIGLITEIEEAGMLLLLDAVHTDAEPGTLFVLTRDEIARFLSIKISPHQLGLREALTLAELRGNLPLSLSLVGLQPANVGFGIGLSPTVAERITSMEEAALGCLTGWGHAVMAMQD